MNSGKFEDKHMLTQDTFEYKNEFPLESGESLAGFELEYSTFGEINEAKDNIVWVCHALTANSAFTEWWPGLFGEGKLYDPAKHFVICANMPGSCYGSTGPLSTNPKTNRPYYHEFPSLTNRDIVKCFDELRKHLQLEVIHTLIGGSLGGQQALEWAISSDGIFKNLILVATNAQHSPWGIAFNESQRQAISLDLTWKLNTEKAGLNGMKVARSIALLSYRHYQTYWNTQKEEVNDKVESFKAATYQIYQGEKLAKRFNAFSYWHLSKIMDDHNVGRDRGSIEKALKSISAECLVVSIASDQLFPVKEQELLVDNISNAIHVIVESGYGHDGFLIETEQLTDQIGNFYKKKVAKEVVTFK